jgi:hypothetical protein
MVRVLALAAAAFAALSPALAARYETAKVELRDITGEVRITTTATDQTEVKITQQGKTTRIVDVRLVDGVLVLTGERWKEDDDRNCCDNRITRNESLAMNRATEMAQANIEGLRKGFFADWPLIEISMPRKGDASFVDARILLSMQQLDGALNLDACYVYGETATLGSAVIGVVHGSRLAIGNVKSLLELDLSGRAEVRAENAAMTDIDIAGPGVVTMGAVDGMMDVSIAGSGRVLSSRLDGPLTARIAGSGVVGVQSGVAERLKATIDGSGGVYFEGVAVQPDLRLYGSAMVRMDSIKGRLTRSGGGQVYIGDKLVEKK